VQEQRQLILLSLLVATIPAPSPSIQRRDEEWPMLGYTLSVLEVSRIIEEAFLPERCVCSSSDGQTLTVQVVPSDNPQNGMTFAGIPMSGLTSSRAIAQLVLELRQELLDGRPPSAADQKKRNG
jgi:hypothetical protein